MINIGIDLADVYVGEEQVEKVYVGAELVWEAVPPLPGVQPDEFEYLFTGKSTDSNISGNTSDSGHEIFVSTADSPEAIPVIRASAFDGAIVCTVNDTDSDGSATHVTTEDITEQQVYGWVSHRWVNPGSATARDNNLGLVLAFNSLDPGTTDSGAHIVINQDHTLAQTYSDGAATNKGDYEYDDPGSSWVTTEAAINPDTDEVVIRTLDGEYHLYTDALAGSVIGIHPDFEFFMQSPDDGFRIEYRHFKSSSIEGMTEDQLTYYNAFLVAGGAEPWEAPPPITEGYVDSAYVEGNPLSTPCTIGMGSDIQTGDLQIVADANMTGATIPAAPASGPTWVTPTNGTISGASNAVRVASKVAASPSEVSGDWSANADSEFLGRIRYRKYTIGVVASATATSSTISFPALPGLTSGSHVMLFAVHDSGSADVTGAPVGFVNRLHMGVADYVAAFWDNTEGAPLSSFAGITLAVGASDALKCFSVELIPVP